MRDKKAMQQGLENQKLMKKGGTEYTITRNMKRLLKKKLRFKLIAVDKKFPHRDKYHPLLTQIYSTRPSIKH